VLSRLFRRLFLHYLDAAFAAGELQFFSDLTALKSPSAFKQYLAPLRQSEWVVFAKRPFAGPEQVLAYLARYTHRVAIANSRLISMSDGKVCFRWKDYRQDGNGKVMILQAGEFIRRFLMHTLPDGFHRIRHYGLFANGHRANKIELCRKLLAAPSPLANRDCDDPDKVAPANDPPPCPCCGGRMKIIETLDRVYGSRAESHGRFDSS
jgi:Putative transposase